MKKHLSVLYLITRESIFRVCLIWIVSFAIQLALLITNAAAEAGSNTKPLYHVSVSSVFRINAAAYIPNIFFITLIVTALVLAKTGMQFQSKTGYTLRRLRIKENGVFILQGAYNSIVLLMLLILEVFVCFVAVLYIKDFYHEKILTPQTLYLTFYESEFIQNIFAGRDILRVIRNFLLMLALGFNLSAFSTLIRRSKKWFPVAVLVTSYVIPFVAEVDFTNIAVDIAFISIGLIFLYTAIIYTVTRGEQYD